MRSSTKKRLSLAALLVALVAAGTLVPIAYRQRQAPDTPVAVAVAPEPDEEAEAAAPPPPGAEVVPSEEAETDRGETSASPAGPTLSFARAAGLHHAPDPLRLNSSAALLVDEGTGAVLASKNDGAVLPVASLTKLMTALVVLEAKQPLDEVLTITEEDVDTMRHSRSRLRVGTRLTREEALRLALMSSENRAAHALGRTYPGGLQKMVQDMNARAQQLGMKDTSYVDPTGLSNRNQSTARDVALLVAAVARDPVLAGFSTTPTHLASVGGRTLQYRNSNRLVLRRGWDIELQKTGYIVEAGRCLTMLTELGGHRVIMVLLDAESNGARLADADRLRRWVVAQYGLPDAVAQARAEASTRKVAAKKGKGSESRRKSTAVAEKRQSPKERKASAAQAKKDSKRTVASTGNKAKREPRSATAKAEKRKSTATARKDGERKSVAGAREDTPRKGARVRQSFAAGKDDEKS